MILIGDKNGNGKIEYEGKKLQVNLLKLDLTNTVF